jgi:hypothetical protein
MGKGGALIFGFATGSSGDQVPGFAQGQHPEDACPSTTNKLFAHAQTRAGDPVAGPEAVVRAWSIKFPWLDRLDFYRSGAAHTARSASLSSLGRMCGDAGIRLTLLLFARRGTEEFGLCLEFRNLFAKRCHLVLSSSGSGILI